MRLRHSAGHEEAGSRGHAFKAQRCRRRGRCPASEEGGTFVSHLRDMPKIRASSRSTSEGSSSPRMAANSRVGKSTVQASPLVDLAGGPYAPGLAVHARHLVAEHLVDACPLLTARQLWYEQLY